MVSFCRSERHLAFCHPRRRVPLVTKRELRRYARGVPELTTLLFAD
jgi:hypothetical protein